MAKVERAAGEAAGPTEETEIVIPRVEERATVEKRSVELERVRVVKRVREHEEPVEVALSEETIEVERVPIGRFADAAEAPRVEGDTTIVPVYEERAVVQTKLWLVEEVRVTKRRAERREVRAVTLRTEEVRTERDERGPRR
jgi:uncharacterized protein (TIGR02271 family)